MLLYAIIEFEKGGGIFMLNIIWLAMIIIAVVFGVINGKTADVVASVAISAKAAVELAIGLIGIMAVWLGLMKIAEQAGLIAGLGRILRPVLRWLFPEVPADHPAMGAIVMNIAANMLGT